MRAILGLWLSIGWVSGAAAAGDYARQWAIETDGAGAEAYRMMINESVYRSVQRTDLGDIDVLDRHGSAVPIMIGSAYPRTISREQTQTVPWFALPEESADCHAKEAASPEKRCTQVLLIDTDKVSLAVTGLQLQWRNDTSVDTAYRVETSENLQDWWVLQTSAPILGLMRNDTQLLRSRIDFGSGRAQRYLRLTALTTHAVPDITQVDATVSYLDEVQPPRQWLTLEGHVVSEGARRYFEYQLPARIAVTDIDVQPSHPSVAQWVLYSREAATDRWRQQLAPWVVSYLSRSDAAANSPPRSIASPLRDRWWRLESTTPMETPPRLRLGYMPEAVTFLAQADGPYTLVAGSARTQRSTVSAAPLLNALSERLGGNWQPASAHLAESSTLLAGDEALLPEPATSANDTASFPWRQGVLWAMLVIGCALVIVLSLKAIKGRS